MENKPVSNLEFFQMAQNGKVIATAEKIKWEFIKNYTFIALIPFVIYKIVFHLIDDKFIRMFNYFESTILNVEEYIKNINLQAFQVVAISIALILCNFLVVGLSSMLIFKKYKVKKEDLSKIMKSVMIIQLVFIIVLSLVFGISYVNKSTGIFIDRYRIEKLLQNDNIGNPNIQNTNYTVDEYVTQVNNIYLFSFIFLMFANVICAISCTFLQEKIIQNNSV